MSSKNNSEPYYYNLPLIILYCLVPVLNTLGQDELVTYPQEDMELQNRLVVLLLGTCYHASSGRMSSLHILREDELEDHSVVFSSSWVLLP